MEDFNKGTNMRKGEKNISTECVCFNRWKLGEESQQLEGGLGDE